MPSATKEGGNVQKRLLRCLRTLEDLLEEDDIILLERLFRSQFFKSALKVGKPLSCIINQPSRPLSTRSQKLNTEVICSLADVTEPSKKCKELLHLLSKLHFQCLLACHDIIASEEFVPKRITSEEFDKETKRITVEKGYNEPLGVTIKNHLFTGAIIISRILHGTPAQREGSFGVGDEIVTINGTDTEGLSLDDVVQLMSLPCNRVNVEVVKDTEVPQHIEITEEKLFVRALFDYDPLSDIHISCQAAGCAFKKGDIIEIVDRNDNRWWQARRISDKNKKVGLIPSKSFQEKRMAHYREIFHSSTKIKGGPTPEGASREQRPMSVLSLNSTGTLDMMAPLDSSFVSSMSISPDSTMNMSSSSEKSKTKHKKKKRKVKFDVLKSEDYKLDDIAAYQQVKQIMSDPQNPRPLLLIGASGMDCEKIATKIIECDPDNFSPPVLYTSRHKMNHEKSNKDIQFVSHSEFEKERKKGNLVNVKSYKTHLTGNPISSLVEIQNSGKICVSEIRPGDLRNPQINEMLPMVVFIKCPSLEQLINSHLRHHPREDNINEEHNLTEQGAVELVQSSERIEMSFSRYIDFSIINEDIDTTFNQIYHVVNARKLEPQWIMTLHDNC